MFLFFNFPFHDLVGHITVTYKQLLIYVVSFSFVDYQKFRYD